jgi:RNA polymerase sigma-70 factor (ECF subfamily)
LAIGTDKNARFERDALPHLAALYNFAVAVAGPADAEDLVQTTCVRALEHFESYQPGTNIRAWLFTILRNESVSRQRHRHRRALTELLGDEEPGDVEDETADLEVALMDQRWAAEIQAALLALPEAHRLPVYLKDVEGFSYREIAEIAGCPLGTVMSRLARGRAALRRALAPQARERGLLPAAADAGSQHGL